MNNNIDISNESLQATADKWYGQLKLPNTAFNRDHNSYVQGKRSAFIEGANYQKEKDKAIFDKLIEALKGFIDNAISDKKIAENQIGYYKGQFRKLLQSLEQDI
jgi:hypothetical protein